MACDCIIGLINHYDSSELATIEDLREYIEDSKYYNEVLVPLYAQSDPQRFMRKIWTLADYGDWRKSTNLTRFRYCPNCGKNINWGEIRRMDDVQR